MQTMPGGVIYRRKIARKGRRWKHWRQNEFLLRVRMRDFVVSANKVENSLSILWTSSMRVKMAVDIENFSKMNWFPGTISATISLHGGTWTAFFLANASGEMYFRMFKHVRTAKSQPPRPEDARESDKRDKRDHARAN
ncbi:Auxin response factor [Forsythia ovata]|uniref:Auxin response factor n=1 Tax=Forsythia ovata TaxID=205694 RepID=A0ABD1QAZ5_9LAMI